MSKSALVLIANGTEEMELYDILVRSGVKATSAYVGTSQSTNVTCSRGVQIVPDEQFGNLDVMKFDALVIPGGMDGAKTISSNLDVQKAVNAFLNSGKIVGMICAASLTALSSGLARQPLTSHPSVKDQLKEHFEYKEENVVISGNLITSRGPGTAFEFALTIVESLLGKEKRAEITGPMVLY